MVHIPDEKQKSLATKVGSNSFTTNMAVAIWELKLYLHAEESS